MTTYADGVGFAFAGVVVWIVLAVVYGVFKDIGKEWEREPADEELWSAYYLAYLDDDDEPAPTEAHDIRTYDEVARTLRPETRENIEMSTR